MASRNPTQGQTRHGVSFPALAVGSRSIMSAADVPIDLSVVADQDDGLDELAAQEVQRAMRALSMDDGGGHDVAAPHPTVINHAIFPAILAFMSRDNASLRRENGTLWHDNRALTLQMQLVRNQVTLAPEETEDEQDEEEDSLSWEERMTRLHVEHMEATEQYYLMETQQVRHTRALQAMDLQDPQGLRRLAEFQEVLDDVEEATHRLINVRNAIALHFQSYTHIELTDGPTELDDSFATADE